MSTIEQDPMLALPAGEQPYESTSEPSEEWQVLGIRKRAAYHVILLWNGSELDPGLKISVRMRTNSYHFETPVVAPAEELGKKGIELLDHPPFGIYAESVGLPKDELFEAA